MLVSAKIHESISWHPVYMLFAIHRYAYETNLIEFKKDISFSIAVDLIPKHFLNIS